MGVCAISNIPVLQFNLKIHLFILSTYLVQYQF